MKRVNIIIAKINGFIKAIQIPIRRFKLNCSFITFNFFILLHFGRTGDLKLTKENKDENDLKILI